MNCIIVPTFPRDFHRTKLLLDTAFEQDEIVLVFSCEEDANGFNHKFPYKSIIVEMDPNTKNFISIKKLEAMRKLANYYEYIAVIDTEAIFLGPATADFENIWNKNCLVGNYSELGGPVMRRIAGLGGYNLYDDIYVWFNDIPVIKTSLLPAFFEWLDRNPIMLSDQYSFEYIIFAIYCKFELKLPWRIIGSERESAPFGLVEDWEWRKYPYLVRETNWSTYYPGIENNENIKILFHLDRIPLPAEFNYLNK